MALRIQITKFRFHQYQYLLRANSPKFNAHQTFLCTVVIQRVSLLVIVS